MPCLTCPDFLGLQSTCLVSPYPMLAIYIIVPHRSESFRVGSGVGWDEHHRRVSLFHLTFCDLIYCFLSYPWNFSSSSLILTYVSPILSYINLQYFVFIRFILITFAAGLPSLKHIYIPPTIASSIQHRTGWNSLSKKYLDINPKIFFAATEVYRTNSHPAVASTRKFLSHIDGQNPTPHGFVSLKCQVTHT